KSVGGKQKGEATLNFHQVLNDVDNSLQLAGTLRVDERIDLDQTDMVWVRIMNSDLRIDIICDVEPEQSGDGVRHLRTKMRAFSAEEKTWLLENLGIPLTRTYWEIVPAESTPYDLYSLGVVFVSSLLSNKHQSLGVSLDHVLHLAQKCSEEGVQGEVFETIGELFSREEEFWNNLGPQLLTNEDYKSSKYIPDEVWFKTLALIVKMFPGFRGVSHVENLADVAGSLSSVFDGAVSEVDSLTELTRSMLLGNWDLNVEISQVLKKFK
ncbi:MAG: hypothetical protein NE330_22400, partial [Lentisphaeraceae bacterium]|nr:hypothetical protein [Lentisphaeraceae bacterium]